MEIESLLDDIPKFLKEIENYNKSQEYLQIDYVNRLKKCYKQLNDIINRTKDEKFIVEGQDIHGEKLKGTSSETVENSFVITREERPSGYGSCTHKNKLLVEHYINHSLCAQDFLDNKDLIKIKILNELSVSGQYVVLKNFWSRDDFKKDYYIKYYIKVLNPDGKFFQYNICKDEDIDNKRYWDGKSVFRTYTFNPSVCQWIILKSTDLRKKLPPESFSNCSFDILSFMNLDFKAKNDTRDGKLSYEIFGLYSYREFRNGTNCNNSKKILLSYLLEQHNTLRPHPEFIKRSEHKFVASKILLKKLFKLTKNYYILGEMKNSKLESIERFMNEIISN